MVGGVVPTSTYCTTAVEQMRGTERSLECSSRGRVLVPLQKQGPGHHRLLTDLHAYFFLVLRSSKLKENLKTATVLPGWCISFNPTHCVFMKCLFHLICFTNWWNSQCNAFLSGCRTLVVQCKSNSKAEDFGFRDKNAFTIKDHWIYRNPDCVLAHLRFQQLMNRNKPRSLKGSPNSCWQKRWPKFNKNRFFCATSSVSTDS